MTDRLVTDDDIALFLLMHKAIRKDLAALTASPQAEWFAFMQRSIHLHHTGEEEWLYPTLLAKDPTFAADVEALTKQHGVLDPLTEEIARGFAAGSTRVGSMLRELERHMNAHLDREEAAVVQRMRRFMTIGELKAFEQREAKRSSFSDLALVLPWVLSSANDREREMVFDVLPFPVKVMYRLSWKKRYERLTTTRVAA
jgi:hypothetical protein